MQTSVVPSAPSLFDTISFVASIASLILAVGAIWLSIVFFKMSAAATTATTEAAKGIGASVERLEKLFDKLYSDTFSMMRDTVSDMRKHMWPVEDEGAQKITEETEKKADEKIADIKRTVEQQIGEMLQRQTLADDKMTSLRREMRQLVDRAIVSSRHAETEAREETAREHILRALRLSAQRGPRIIAEDILARSPFPPSRTVRELERMRDEGLIHWGPEPLGPETVIRIGSGLLTSHKPDAS